MTTVQTCLGVGLLGALGALLRYGLDSSFPSEAETFPTLTLIINICGSFAAGAFSLSVGEWFPESWRAPLLVGLAGGFTTFSRMSLDSCRLLQSGRVWPAAVNLSLGPVLGCVAAFFGMWLVSLALPPSTPSPFK